MNKEEKETVEELRKQLRLAINIDDVATTIRNDDAETILNLIEKLSKENEQLRTEMNSLQKENNELNKKLILQKGIGDYWCEAYMELQKERERKK